MAANNTTGFVCNPLLGNSDSIDGGLPLVLGVNLTFAACIPIVFCFMLVFLKGFTMVSPKNKRQGEQSESEGGGGGEEEKGRRDGSSFINRHGYCAEVINFFLMNERGVRDRIGPDASLYLVMELYLLIILVIFSFFSIVIILPINYLLGDIQISKPFARTTVANLSGESAALWSHVLFSIIYVVIVGMFMIHYALRLGKLQKKVSSHTVLIYGVPKFTHVEDLKQHFEEALPGTQVVDIRFAYNVKDLQKKWDKLKKASLNVQLAEAYEAETGRPTMIRRSACDCSNRNLVNAREFYLSKVEDLRVSVAMERTTALTKKLPIAFVTFAKPEAQKMYEDSYKLCRHKPQSSLSDNIRSSSWSLALSPFAKDVAWKNLAFHPALWWLRWVAINLVMIVFLIFFTTPPVIINSSEEVWLFIRKRAGTLNITLKNATGYGVPGWIQSYASSFLALILGQILAFLITRSVYLEYHWSKSREQQSMLRKAFIFLTLQVLILPSLGLTSLSAVAALVVHGNEEGIHNQLSCVFLPNHGAYFITFVIIATFVSTPLELLRLQPLTKYIYKRLKAESKLEKQKITYKGLTYDFKIGIQYGFNLLVFTLTVAFSLTTPIIVPLGVVFFGIKYVVDKFNLLYGGYRPSYISGRQYLHKSALKLVMVGAVHLQLVTLFYSIVREGKVKPRSIVMIITVCITSLILFGLLILGWFSHLLPKMRLKLNKNYYIFGYEEEEDDRVVEPGEYIAPVLLETARKESGAEYDPPETTGIPQDYDSFGKTDADGK